MFRLIKAHLKGAARICAIFAPLSMMLEVFMDLQQPTLMSRIIDNGVAAGNLSYVLSTGGRMILFALIGLIGGAGCTILTTYASTHMAGFLRKTLFEKIFSLSSAEVDRFETSSLAVRMTNDVSQVQDLLSMLLRAMTRSPLLFVGGMVMAFLLSPSLALILCAALPLLAVAAVLIVRRAVPMYAVVQRRMDRLNTVTRENLLGARVVKAFALTGRQTDQFGSANGDFVRDSVRAQTATILLMPIVTLVMNLSVVAVLWFGGNMEIAGQLPMGRIMAFVNYLVQITNALMMLVNFTVNISRSQASAQRIMKVLDTRPSVAPPEHPAMPQGADLELSHVIFSYGGGENVLKDITLTIPKGLKVGVIGATGCGKSTLAALITRLYDPTEGSICLGGADLKDIPEARLHKSVGLVMQTSLLFSGTVADNLRFGNQEAGEEALWAAAEDAQAAEFLRALPGGLEGEVAQRGRNFSGGQKQRLSIARTLLAGPDILILDDSTSAVDLITEARLLKALAVRMKDATVIVIAQRVSSIMDCGLILVMDKGAVIARGTHEELMENSDLYRSIVVSQLGEEALRHA